MKCSFFLSHDNKSSYFSSTMNYHLSTNSVICAKLFSNDSSWHISIQCAPDIIFHQLMTIYRKIASSYYQDMACIYDITFNFSRNFKKSAPSCHDEEACSRFVRILTNSDEFFLYLRYSRGSIENK